MTTIEHEPGDAHDLREMLERLIPARRLRAQPSQHDTNSHAHQRASIVGPSLTVPIVGGRLAIGTWQQLVLLDFDDRPRERTVLIQVVS